MTIDAYSRILIMEIQSSGITSLFHLGQLDCLCDIKLSTSLLQFATLVSLANEKTAGLARSIVFQFQNVELNDVEARQDDSDEESDTSSSSEDSSSDSESSDTDSDDESSSESSSSSDSDSSEEESESDVSDAVGR
jgi:hypothetical protein